MVHNEKHIPKRSYAPTPDKPLGIPKDRQTLITGGAGFLGQELITHLNDLGIPTDVFDIARGDDIMKRRSLRKRVPEGGFIFHLAALLGTHELIPPRRAQEALKVNVEGS